MAFASSGLLYPLGRPPSLRLGYHSMVGRVGLTQLTSEKMRMKEDGSGCPALPFLSLRALMVCDHLALWSQRSVAQAGGRRLQPVVRCGGWYELSCRGPLPGPPSVHH